MNLLIQWFDDIRGSDTLNRAATKAGIDGSNLHRHIVKKEHLPATMIIQLAHAYGVSAIHGLVKGGYLTEDDIKEYVSSRPIYEASDLEIARELVTRLRRAGASLDMFNENGMLEFHPQEP